MYPAVVLPTLGCITKWCKGLRMSQAAAFRVFHSSPNVAASEGPIMSDTGAAVLYSHEANIKGYKGFWTHI